MKVEAIRFVETSMNFFRNARRHIREHSTFQEPWCLCSFFLVLTFSNLYKLYEAPSSPQ
jgi:hypothetical protein